MSTEHQVHSSSYVLSIDVIIYEDCLCWSLVLQVNTARLKKWWKSWNHYSPDRHAADDVSLLYILILSLLSTICSNLGKTRKRKTLISNRGRWSPLSLFRQVHLGVGKSEYDPPFSGLRAASTWEAVGCCGSHRQTDVLAKLSSWLGGWSPFCGDNGRHTAQVWERRSLRCRQLWVGG